MKIIGLNGSPRKDGNTQTLMKAVLQKAAEKGAETRLVNLNELNITGCQGCDACKKHLGKCVQKDDLSPLLQEMKDYDTIVFGTPIYWYHVSGQFKILIDRLYSYWGEGKDAETGEESPRFWFPAGKKVVIITSQEAPEPFQPIQDWLNLIATVMNASSTEFITHCSSESKKNSAANDTEIMNKACAIGASLV